MWNLSDGDIERAKAELKGRRAAIQAQYESEMKKVDADLANIEMFERAAMSFVSSYKGDEPAPAPATAEPAPAMEHPVAETEPEPAPAQGWEAPTEPGAEAQPVTAAPEKAEKGSSRWRMRLSSAEGASS